MLLCFNIKNLKRSVALHNVLTEIDGICIRTFRIRCPLEWGKGRGVMVHSSRLNIEYCADSISKNLKRSVVRPNAKHTTVWIQSIAPWNGVKPIIPIYCFITSPVENSRRVIYVSITPRAKDTTNPHEAAPGRFTSFLVGNFAELLFCIGTYFYHCTYF